VRKSYVSLELCLGEVKLWVSIHEGLKLVFLLHLIACWKALLLLLLIEHHLLYCGASFGIKVGEFGVLGLDLLSVDLGVAFDDTVPPVHPVHLD
jgi:hypothetical protein